MNADLPSLTIGTRVLCEDTPGVVIGFSLGWPRVRYDSGHRSDISGWTLDVPPAHFVLGVVEVVE